MLLKVQFISKSIRYTQKKSVFLASVPITNAYREFKCRCRARTTHANMSKPQIHYSRTSATAHIQADSYAPDVTVNGLPTGLILPTLYCE